MGPILVPRGTDSAYTLDTVTLLRTSVLLLATTFAGISGWSQERLVIADQDASTTADMALLLLLRSPEVHLLGITIVPGNTWRDEEIAHALRMLEGIHRTDVPVYAGAAFPLVRTAEETRLYDRLYGTPSFLGAYTAADAPVAWDKVEAANVPEGMPATRVSEESAAEYMVRTVRAHPHQVTIVALGPLTNVALACRLDPHFSEMVKELVLMGGSLNPQTTAAEWTTRPRHEFNFWFDPEAASIALREKWAKVTTTTVDVSLETRADPEVLDGLKKAESEAARWVTRYTHRPLFPNYLWDELAVAAWLDPTLIKEERVLYMDVATDHGAAYGDTLIYNDSDKPALAPSRVHAIVHVDLSRLQKMLIERLSK
jgi:purine nucleosidase